MTTQDQPTQTSPTASLTNKKLLASSVHLLEALASHSNDKTIASQKFAPNNGTTPIAVTKPQRVHKPYDMALWCTIGSNLKEGPIRTSQIQLPKPWPASRRIPGQTLPPAGGFRFVKLTQCGPLGMGRRPGVLSLRPYLQLNPEKNVFKVNTDEPVPKRIKDHVNFKAYECLAVEDEIVVEATPPLVPSKENAGGKKKGGKKGKGGKGKKGKKGKKK